MAEDTKFNEIKNITQLVNEINILVEEWANVTYKLNKSKSSGFTIMLKLRLEGDNIKCYAFDVQTGTTIARTTCDRITDD